jgi:hypothetical protein
MFRTHRASRLARQVLVSHDICNKPRLSRYGGEEYAHLLTRVLPLMRRKGIDDAGTDLLFSNNPASVLAVSEARKRIIKVAEKNRARTMVLAEPLLGPVADVSFASHPVLR